MADEGSKWGLVGIAFLIGLVIGYMIREHRRNYLTEFTRDTTGRIISLMETELR